VVGEYAVACCGVAEETGVKVLDLYSEMTKDKVSDYAAMLLPSHYFFP